MILSFVALIASFFMQSTTLTVENSWVRVGAQDGNTALYFDAVNPTSTPDTLYAAQYTGAKMVEVHETYEAGSGRLGMRKTDFVVIPAKSTFNFKPKAHHVMLMKLKQDIKVGDEVEVTLLFKKAGSVKVKATAK